MEPVYSTAEKDRTFFVADLSRLRQEGDTLVNAMVVYTPEADLKRVLYEQRCSQLVGLALCTMNFTGKYPDYLRLRSTGFAIRALGQHYIMGLQGRHDEPKEGAVECLNAIHDCFRFYYHSPAAVLKTSQGDWEIFTCHMASIFSLILQHMSGDKHTVQAMFNTLPYTDPTAWGRDGPRLFLLASRVLRACQQHYSIIGGCITHTKDTPTSANPTVQIPVSRIVCSQFPPILTEKLVLAGGQGVELNSKSIVEDNITPDKVWVIEVYLTEEEQEAADDQRKDLSALQSTYASLDNNPHLASSLFHQPTSPRGGRQRGQWRKKSPSHRRKSPSLVLLSRSTSPTKKPPPEEAVYEEVEEVELDAPAAASTPNPKARPRSGSLKSEDAIQLDPEEGTATYNPKKKPILKTSSALGKPHGGTTKRTSMAFRPLPPIPGDESGTDFGRRIDIYADDCVDSILDTASNAFYTPPPTQPHQMTTTAEDRGVAAAQPIQSAANRDSDGDVAGSRPSTASSEGFATPPPTLPGDFLSQQKKVFVGSGPLALSGDTDRSSLFQSARETSLPLTREGGQDLETSSKQSTLTHKDDSSLGDSRDQAPELPPRPSHLHHARSRNSPPKLPPKPPNALPSALPQPPPVDTQPAFLRNWRFRAHPASDSDDESDFVSSTELRHMLMENKQASKIITNGKESDAGETDARTAEDGSKLAEEGTVPVENGEPTPAQELAVEESDVQASTQPAETLANGDPSQQRSESPPLTTAKNGGLSEISEYSDGPSNETQLTPAPEASVNGNTGNGNTEHENTGNGNMGNGNTEHGNTGNGNTEHGNTGNGNTEHGNTETLPGKGEEDVYDDIIVRRSPVIANEEPSPTNGTLEPEVSAVQSDVSVERVEKAEELQDAKLEGVSENVTVETEPIGLDVIEQTGADSGTSVDGPEDKPDDDAAGGDAASPDGPTELDKGTSVDGPEFEIVHRSSSLLSSGKTLVNEVADRLAPANDVEESLLSEMDVRYDANSSISAGLMTPVEMTLTEAAINASKLEVSGEFSSLPEDEGEEEGAGLDVQGGAVALKTRAGSWVHKTLERQPVDKPAPRFEKKCLYVQRYMNTVITLLADEGLNQEQEVLQSLWQSLLPQLYELDVGLKKGDEAERHLSAIKPHNSIAIYSATDRKCEALPNTAIYHVRHAFRRAHQEYLKDPSILQIGLSKEHVRMLSQRVLEREVYFNPGRMGHVDALSILSAIERYAKVKQGPWQEKLLLIS